MQQKLRYTKTLWRTRRLFLAVLLVVPLSPIVYFGMEKGRVIIEDLIDTNSLVRKSLYINAAEDDRICNIPQLDPFADDIEKLTKELPIVKCPGRDWVKCHKSHCYFVKAKNSKVRVKDIVCLYRDVIYMDDIKFYLSRPRRVIGEKKYTLIKSDHVRIDCSRKRSTNPGFYRWSGLKAGFRSVSTEVNPLKQNHKHFNNTPINVMVLCFDSTSRNGFIRKMGKSYTYLTEKLNGVILNGYNIVGDGTTGALFPLLSGKPVEEHNTWGPKPKYIDPQEFIFHFLKGYGYRTAFFEDKPWKGTADYQFNWFKNQPADHYLRTMLLADDREGEKWYHGRPLRHCFGDTPQYQVLMNLADEFLQLDGKKFCFTSIVDMAYENFTIEPTVDDVLLTSFQNLSARGALENTLVIVMGDHGSRFASTHGTQARLEERLPLMAVLLPENLIKRRPAALVSLRNNVNVLTTAFDIYATILDVLDLKEESIPHLLPGSHLPRAMSLLQPIPRSRSCGEAGVLPHWCTCKKWSNVPRSSPMYVQVAAVLVDYINSITLEQRSKCAKRHLISTEWVIHQKITDHLSKVNYFKMKEVAYSRYYNFDDFYQAKIVISPGRSVFEGTMIYNRAGDHYIVTERDISRVNSYGDEPKCISSTHPHLNKFCYCVYKVGNININRTAMTK